MAKRISTIVLSTLFAAIAAGAANAGPPPEADDVCTTPTYIIEPSGSHAAYTNVATESGSDPIHSCTGNADFNTVWLAYTATYDGLLELSAAPTNPGDHVILAVYTGDCGTLSEVDCSAPVSGNPSIPLTVVSGETYYFQLSTPTSTSGNSLLSVSGPPTHDICSAPKTIPTAPANIAATQYKATEDASDPVHSCTGDADLHTVWYTYTAPGDGTVNLTALPGTNITLGGPVSYPIVLGVYSGTCGALTEMQCAAGASGMSVTVSFPVVGGETYIVETASATPLFATPPFGGLGGHSLTATFVVPTCGDGMQNQPSEECDDGNVSDNDACTTACQNAECGDGILYVNVEQCDDGNVLDGDGCQSDCTTVCGDGIEAGNEQCDDGNAVEDDGCDTHCRQPCPYNLCSCLPNAGLFAAVAGDSVQVKTGQDAGEPVESEAFGSVCSVSGKFTAKGADNLMDGDLVLTAGSGDIAGKFTPLKIDGMVEPGAYVGGVFATGGGTVKGLEFVTADGGTSFDGSSPAVPVCTQAMAEIADASSFLAAQTPTQTIPSIRVEDGDIVELNVGSGLQVISVGSIEVKSGNEMGTPLPSELDIVLAPDTDMVIINVAKLLSVGEDSQILVVGDVEKVVINMWSSTPSVKLKSGALVDPVLIVPARGVKLPLYAGTSNIYTGAKAILTGAGVEDVLLCE